MIELTTSQVGISYIGMYMSDYFESEDLEESLQQLIDDTESTVGITIQIGYCKYFVPYFHLLS